jgi:F0F1-type ATP synthase membrane subunit b/b'
VSWLFDKKKRQAPEIPETLSLTAEQVISSTPETQQHRLDSISYDLQKRLKNELSGIISEVVDSALDNTRAEVEQIIRNELVTMLESRLDLLVEQAIKTHLTKPRSAKG